MCLNFEVLLCLKPPELRAHRVMSERSAGRHGCECSSRPSAVVQRKTASSLPIREPLERFYPRLQVRQELGAYSSLISGPPGQEGLGFRGDRVLAGFRLITSAS